MTPVTLVGLNRSDPGQDFTKKQYLHATVFQKGRDRFSLTLLTLQKLPKQVWRQRQNSLSPRLVANQGKKAQSALFYS